MSLADRIRVHDLRVLSDDHYVLKKTTFDWRRDDGDWQTVSRETYDRGSGVTLLPYNRPARTVILTRQFRYPAYVNGYDELMIDTCAGLFDEAAPDMDRAELLQGLHPAEAGHCPLPSSERQVAVLSTVVGQGPISCLPAMPSSAIAAL